MRLYQDERIWKLLPVLALAALLAGTVPRKGGASVSTSETGDLRRIVDGNTRFAFELYNRLRAEPGDLFFSPYSVSSALAMTYAGARHETARQIAATFHFGLPDERLHAAFGALVGLINGPSPGAGAAPARPYELVTANALWGDRGDTFLPAFLDLTRKDYGAGLRQVDFRNAHDAARREINAWVEGQTRERIRDLLGPGDVDASTSLVLTNAIYFKGAWASPFSEAATDAKGVFHLAGGRTATVPLMRQTARFAYRAGETFQLVELPYRGGALSMVVILPKTADGLPALEASLSPEVLAGWIGRASSAQVELTLPRFTMTRPTRLDKVLSDMGMPDAFGAGADFSGMNGRRDLSISAVAHKAFVEVNEKGTEAAAATGVMMARAGMLMPSQPVVFRADHPFVFLIRERSTGSVLFLGRLVEPKA